MTGCPKIKNIDIKKIENEVYELSKIYHNMCKSFPNQIDKNGYEWEYKIFICPIRGEIGHWWVKSKISLLPDSKENN